MTADRAIPGTHGQTHHPVYKAYLCTVVALGAFLVGFSVYRVLQMNLGYEWLVLAGLTVLTSTYTVKIPAINSKISIGDTFFFTNTILYGIPAGVITAALDALSGSFRARTRSRRAEYILFNVAAVACSAHISGAVFFRLIKSGPLFHTPLREITSLILPLGVLAFTHYLCNSGSVAAIVALEKRKNFFFIWRDGFLWTSITYFAGAAAGGFIAVTMGTVRVQALGVMVAVMLAVYFTYRTYLDKINELDKLKVTLEEQVRQRTLDLQVAIEKAQDMARQAEAASLAKSQFLATMSHEIRTPLNAVIGYSEMLEEEAQESGYGSLVADLRKINAAGRHLLELIGDILDFSKIEAGKLNLERAGFDLHQTVEATTQVLAVAAQRKQIKLVSSIEEDVPVTVKGDPARLRQVLTNLIGNAIKFTHEGEVRVRVSREASCKGNLVHFEVRDTGIGISRESQKLIFDAFSQADGSTTRKYGGTGLGLAIVKRLVEMMGGQMGVQSEPGRGSTFWFTACLEEDGEPLADPISQRIPAVVA